MRLADPLETRLDGDGWVAYVSIITKGDAARERLAYRFFWHDDVLAMRGHGVFEPTALPPGIELVGHLNAIAARCKAMAANLYARATAAGFTIEKHVEYRDSE